MKMNNQNILILKGGDTHKSNETTNTKKGE